MTKPKRVRTRTAGVRGYKAVTRNTVFGNPFRVGVDCSSRAEAVTLFEAWIKDQAELVALAKVRLKGRDLACACPLDEPCHADVWLRLVNEGD